MLLHRYGRQPATSQPSKAPGNSGGGSGGVSSGEPNMSLSYWSSRCSICFEHRCDIHLPGCQDQFCLSCISQYFKHLIENSWGLSRSEFKCPVCHDTLPQKVWSRYVDRNLLERYLAANPPYKQLARHCQACDKENAVVEQPLPERLSPEERDVFIRHIDHLMRRELHASPSTCESIQSDLARVLRNFDGPTTHENGMISIDDLYHAVYQRLQGSGLAQPETPHWPSLGRLLAAITRLERQPTRWKALQYLHVRSFPKMNCTACNAPICLQCGESDHHSNVNCAVHLETDILARQGRTEDAVLRTMCWKLLNSKPCPNCSVRISRDEGCNKVDCSCCGQEFCWVCLRGWSTACGFFKCTEMGTSVAGGPLEKQHYTPSAELLALAERLGVDHFTPGSADSLGMEEAAEEEQTQPMKSQVARRFEAEAGVPNVLLLEERLYLRSGNNVQKRSASSGSNPAGAGYHRHHPKQKQPGAYKRITSFFKDWLFASASYASNPAFVSGSF